MQPIGIAQPLGRAGRRHQAPLAMALHQVLDDRARLRERELAVGEHRRLAERMHFAQRGGREHRLRIALIALDLVRQSQFLQQPQNSLRAGVVEVMKREHGAFLWSLFDARFG